MRPRLRGPGGFLLAAHDHIVAHNTGMDLGQLQYLRDHALHGWEIVDSAARLCVMNLYLHGIGGDETNIKSMTACARTRGVNFDLVLTNPPFGKKSAVTYFNSEGKPQRESLVAERPDFWASSSNKQLNFLQHVRSLLKIPRPDGDCRARQRLFEGGAGETVRRDCSEMRRTHAAAAAHGRLLRARRKGQCALLRPQTGQRSALDAGTLDLRPTHQPTLYPENESPDPPHLDDFVTCYNAEDRSQRKKRSVSGASATTTCSNVTS